MHLHRTNVNVQVKGRFQPHFDLLMTDGGGGGWLKNRLWNFSKWRISTANPTTRTLKILTSNHLKNRKSLLLAAVNDFMKYFGYCNADTAEGLPQPLKGTLIYHLQKTGDENQWILVPYHEKPQDDEVFNYSMQPCHWYLHILELHDTANEGDLN